jgi:hypothetical protein
MVRFPSHREGSISVTEEGFHFCHTEIDRFTSQEEFDFCRGKRVRFPSHSKGSIYVTQEGLDLRRTGGVRFLSQKKTSISVTEEVFDFSHGGRVLQVRQANFLFYMGSLYSYKKGS